ncbi:MAG: ATP-dependent helicase [Candidatus Promineifilaceae bacterium]|nr:ATP-dependent helicase [Candidatus Promineifilaceae bacterium]
MADFEYRLRPAQEEILQYEGGRMAVSAVPGSGKTFTLSLLAAQLIAGGRVDAATGQEVLIVTYLNSSVDAFKASVRRHLLQIEHPLMGFDVRTLHSLGLEIVRTAAGGLPGDDELIVLDETQAANFLNQATAGWIDDHPTLWRAFLPEEESLRLNARWRDVTERTAAAFIRTAKNERYRPEIIGARLERAWKELEADEEADRGKAATLQLVHMLNGIYARYQNILRRQGALDFDDLIWEAADLLEERPDLAESFRQRWPYVLEDEAQDSVPLQEALLSALSGLDGNWVRVGDPNQAITSTFTAAHPRYFNAFIDRPDVVARPLPNSGRSAPRIFEAANTMLHWVMDEHPVPEVREHAFRRQNILPTPPGDAQPNPPDTESNIRIKVYAHREDEELPAVARLAVRYANARPDHTLAILVPTNDDGFHVAEHLDELDADYDSLLRGGAREREIAAVMQALLRLLADPLDTAALADAHQALVDLEHPAAGALNGWATGENGDDGRDDGRSPELERFHAILRSVHRPEQLLFPDEEDAVVAALPAGVATEEDYARLEPFVAFLQRIFDLRPLPIGDLTLALGDELFARAAGREDGDVRGDARGDERGDEREVDREYDLAIAYHIASLLSYWRDLHPAWRLPELATELADVASGRRSLPSAPAGQLGFEPEPGRITLATQHKAKGMEWDAVFLVGIDGFWIPSNLDAPFLGVHDFLGGDPTAEATAQLRHLMDEDAGLYPGRSATESAHIEVICERLRLLYVGITRARRYLHISRSRATRRHNRDRDAEPTTVLGVLYRYLQEHG